MKILSLSTPAIDEYARLTGRNHLAYCTRHGYEYEHLWDTDTVPPAWEKLNLILRQKNGPLFWIDADAQFMDFEKRISDFDRGFDFTFSHNVGLNSGVFIVHLNTRSRKVLEEISAMDKFRGHPHWEQAAIIQYFRDHPDYFNRNVLINKSLAHDGPHYTPGDFIVHLPGTTHAERVNAFTNHFRKYE